MREIGDYYKGIASPALRRDRNDRDKIMIIAVVIQRDRNDPDKEQIIAAVLQQDRNDRNNRILFNN